jgi:cytochrome P450
MAYKLVSMANILLLVLILIELMPFASAKVAYESLENWGQYMNELFAKKVIEAQKGERSGGMDIMGSLVRSAYSDVELSKSKASPGNAEKGQAGKIQALTDDEILGNAFVMILAGHETTANSIHFSLVMLAMAAGSQRRLQRELTAIFGNSEPETWDYESNINALLGGMAGAVLNEELRILPPVINLPKSVRKDQDVPMIVDGQKYLFPKGAYINISIAAVHKNDKFWPSRGPSKITDSKNDLGDFIPERWLLNNNIAVPKTDLPHIDDPEGNDAYGGFTGTSTAAGLVRPTAGSYMPFSDGARSCLGRRLAQVEMMAMIAVIFQKWSVELAVDDWATDEEVKKMGSKEKKELYEKAMERTRTDLLAATSRITLKLHEGRTYIPMRLVKRGEERFLGLFD